MNKRRNGIKIETILFLYLVEAGQFYEVVKTDEND